MKSVLETVLYCAYQFPSRKIQALIHSLIYRLEQGEVYSPTLRRIFRERYGVDIGMYTHGGCFVPGSFDRYTTIGRYSSIASAVRAMNRNHPLELKSMHAIFFNPIFGFCDEDSLEYIPLTIGSDVWIGHGAIVLPAVKSIGHGAVVAAGAVVGKNIPPYAVAVGNPARVVRYRFSEDVIDSLLRSEWWEKDPHELKSVAGQFQVPYQALWQKAQEKCLKEDAQEKQHAC
jgi:virginiamycin A acetyltransferase